MDNAICQRSSAQIHFSSKDNSSLVQFSFVDGSALLKRLAYSMTEDTELSNSLYQVNSSPTTKRNGNIREKHPNYLRRRFIDQIKSTDKSTTSINVNLVGLPGKTRWRFDVQVNALVFINKVALRQARLLLEWVTI